VANRRSWADFRHFMIDQYERMLREGGGSTMGQDGYSTAFVAATDGGNADEDNELMSSVTRFAERGVETETKVDALQAELDEIKSAMAALTMGASHQHPPPSIVYAPPPPQVAYFTPMQAVPGDGAQAWAPTAPPHQKRKNPRNGAMVDWTMTSRQAAAPP
jgi:hypothetical protein